MRMERDASFKQYPSDVSLPDYLDWREKNLVTPVRSTIIMAFNTVL